MLRIVLDVPNSIRTGSPPERCTAEAYCGHERRLYSRSRRVGAGMPICGDMLLQYLTFKYVRSRLFHVEHDLDLLP